MKRLFFFALLFPPALMDLMLVLAHPVSLPRYFLSGYVVAAVPALLVALVDEVLAQRSLTDRAGYGAFVAFVSAPVLLRLLEPVGMLRMLQIGSFAAIAAFICVVAFGKFSQPKREKKKMLLLPAPVRLKESAAA